MQLILASSNKGKIKELEYLLPNFNVIAYSEILGNMDIEETGTTFKENAIIKAQAVNEALKSVNYDKDYIVLADDSGISVPVLNNKPNIYSARYAGLNATDKQNNEKLISKLNEKNLNKTPAFYTACLALIYKDDISTTHGWMHGNVTNKEVGQNGFGYDPLFIPNGYDKTLGELDSSVKKGLSHRSKALNLAIEVINVIL